jgi:sulfoxide reductase heme-binding subunit YedZ
VHWLAYAAWPVALLHGLGTGTDAGQLWLRALAAGCVTAVLAIVGWRMSEQFAETTLSRSEGPR